MGISPKIHTFKGYVTVTSGGDIGKLKDPCWWNWNSFRRSEKWESHNAELVLGVSPVQRESAAVVLELNGSWCASTLGWVGLEIQPSIKLCLIQTHCCRDWGKQGGLGLKVVRNSWYMADGHETVPVLWEYNPLQMHNLFLVKDMWPNIEVLGQLIQLKISLNILKEKTVVT